MSLETRIAALATAIGTDIKAILDARGALANLTTIEKGSIVGAINEIAAAVASATGIDDGTTSGSSTWSSTKISSEVAAAVAALVDSSPSTLDTLNEIAAALEDNPNVIDALRTLITANETAISTLSTNIGDTDANFVTTYTTARDAV